MKQIDDVVVEDEVLVIAEWPEIEYALVYRKGAYEPWVAAHWFDNESGTWGQGHYFHDLLNACEYIEGIRHEYEMDRIYGGAV